MIEYPVTVATRGATIETTVTASVLATADAVIDQARREAGIAPAAFARGEIGHTGDTAGPARAVADGGHPARPVRVPVETSTGECWHVPGGCAGHRVKTIAATATELVDERELRPCQAHACQNAGIEAPVRCDGCGVAVFDPDERGAARYCPDCLAYVEAHPDERDHDVYALREPDAPVPVTDGGQGDGEVEHQDPEDSVCTEFRIKPEVVDAEGNDLRAWSFKCTRCGHYTVCKGDPRGFGGRPYACVNCAWVSLIDQDAVEAFAEENNV